MNALIKFLATGFGSGYAPVAPGTCGSIIGVGLVYLLQGLDSAVYALVTAIVVFFSVWISTRAEALFGERDCQKIVIDEIAGILVTFVWIPFTGPTVIAGFLLFRLFDVVKPPPIRQSQKMTQGWGVVMDDVFAGVLANIILQVGLTAWYLYVQ